MSAKSLSDDHKAKLADGRRRARIVSRYLEQIETEASSRRPTPSDLEAEIDRVEAALATASGLDRLELLQERENLQHLSLGSPASDWAAQEEQFIAVAKAYGDAKGISYSTWREFGVPKPVLEAAGIKRTRRRVRRQ